MKKYILYFSSMMMVILSLSLYYTYETEIIEPDIEKNLREIATPYYLEQKILKSLSNNNIDNANRYNNLSQYLNIKIDNQEINRSLEKANSFLPSVLRDTQHFILGFKTGESDDSASMAGAIVSDMTLFGDGLDLYKEGTKMVEGEEYDKFTIGISSIGFVLTASTYVTIGSTAILKVGASIIKTAHKRKKISKPFMKVISSKISKSINFSLLKHINWSSIAKFKSSVNKFTKTINLLHIQDLLVNLDKISENISKSDTVKVMEYIDSSEDLNKTVIISSKFKTNTVAIFDILGKDTLKSGKVEIKYTGWFIVQIISFIFCFLLFIETISFPPNRRC